MLVFLLLTQLIPLNKNQNLAYKERTISEHSDIHTTTRGQALINYTLALYSSKDGAFYGYLRAWPTDPRIKSELTIFQVRDPYNVLSTLNYSSAFDWSECKSFLGDLVNDESTYDVFSPVNASYSSAGCVITLRIALEIFSNLSILEQLDVDGIKEFIKANQLSDGGFAQAPWLDQESNLINTECALWSLSLLDELSAIDIPRVLNFVLGCYHDGGFAYAPGLENEYSAVVLGLMCLDYLDEMDRIDTEAVFQYLLNKFDNSTGHWLDGTIVDTERAVWAFSLMGYLDRINQDAIVDWVLSCQSSQHGAFLSSPRADWLDERLEWARAACHILSLLGRLDVFEQELSVIDYPEHTTPQAYYDFIEEHISPTTGNGNHFVIPNIDVLGFLINAVPYAVVFAIIISPFWYLYRADKAKREERRRRKKRGPS